MILLIWKGRDVFGDLLGRRSVIGYILIYYDCDVFGDLLGRQYSKVCDVFGDLLGRQTACGLRDYHWNMKNKELILETRIELVV